MKLHAKRWNDAREPGDGTRVLVCRYRPRGVRREDETWDEWRRDLAPSAQLLAAFHGKHGAPISWPEYERRFLGEIAHSPAVHEMAERVARGEAITLLCSSACVDPARCHRTILVRLIEEDARASPRSARVRSTRPSRLTSRSSRLRR